MSKDTLLLNVHCFPFYCDSDIISIGLCLFLCLICMGNEFGAVSLNSASNNDGNRANIGEDVSGWNNLAVSAPVRCQDERTS